METPHVEHFTRADYDHIYEPAEDSFLLLDALESDLNYLEALQPQLCVEIGSGSGIIITALAKRLAKSTLCLATDINPHACRGTLRTALNNGANVNAINCNLTGALRNRSIDLLVFNPPYVVTSEEELLEPRDLVYSWAGGKDGRKIIDKLLGQLDDILSPHGVFYLLLLRENKPEEIIEELTKKLQFKAVKLMERRIPGEYLYVLKITRMHQ